jgi:hypothetical protein
MHTQLVRHWWNRKQGMARRVIHIRTDGGTFELELIQGRDEGGKRWVRIYTTYEVAHAEALEHMKDPVDEWRDITNAHRR